MARSASDPVPRTVARVFRGRGGGVGGVNASTVPAVARRRVGVRGTCAGPPPAVRLRLRPRLLGAARHLALAAAAGVNSSRARGRAGGRRPPYATVGGACVRRRAATNAAGGTAQRGRLVAFTEDPLMELL